MEDLKKKINFDPSLLYYSPSNKEAEEDEKSTVTNVETYNSTNRKHVCVVCGKRFFTISALNLHIEHHPPNERTNVEKNDTSNLNRNNQYVWNKGIKCNKQECNFIALDAVEYSKHISSCEGVRVTKESENVSFCDLCDAYFSSENHFKAHLILKHPDCDPDISLKEYDAKHTTISDPVSLYVSENNLENDDDVKQAKVAGHSKYPDSFISKKKSKECETEDSVQNKEVTNDAVGEVTVINKTEPTPKMDEIDDVDKSKSISEVNIDDVSNEIPTKANDSVVEIINEDFFTQNESEKSNEISETTIDENVKEIQNEVEVEGKNDEINLQDKQPESPEISRVVEIEINLEDVCNERNPCEVVVTPTNAISDNNEEEILPPKKVENSKPEIVNTKELENKLEEESINRNVKVQNDASKISHDNNITKNTVDHQVCIEDKKNNSKEKDDEKEKSDSQEEYMNVEEMMYNLFKDEGACENSQKTSVSSEQNIELQDSKNNVSDQKEEEHEEEKKQLSDEKTDNKFDSNVKEEAKKDDSDFEEFDYSRAGKKKYLKSYGRLNKSKLDSNAATSTSKVAKTPEKIQKTDKSPYSRERKISKTQLEESAALSVDRTKTESCDGELSSSTSDSNIKERSTRTRKKLILPDYEYDSDYKSYCAAETSHKRSDVTKRPSISKNADGTPRKRGRPRKIPIDVNHSTTDVDESPNSKNTSSTSVNKSVTKIKEKIENSYLNTGDTSTKTETIDEIVESIEVYELSESTTSRNESLENDEGSKSDLKPHDVSDSITPKKKRGRPRKIKREVKRTSNDVGVSSETTPIIDKTAEENIFSDLANALLSLGDPVTKKTKEEVSTGNDSSFSEKPVVGPVAIIKRRKKSFKPSLQPDDRPSPEIANEPTFEMKNDIESDLGDTSTEVDDNLSFNNANTFEKEKLPEEKMTTFMKDISLVANVSTPKKRGRPPKVHKDEKTNATPNSSDISTSKAAKKTDNDSSLLDVREKASQVLKSKVTDRRSVFLKNKKIKRDKIKNHLDSVSFSLLKSDSTIRKRGRPPKLFKGEIKKSEIPSKPDARDEEHMDVSNLRSEIDEHKTETPNLSATTNEIKTPNVEVIKKKKGRPPKIKPSLDGDTSIAQNISMNASKSSEVSDKDLNLNELENSHKRREDSPFIHENYHPKKKRSRIENNDDIDADNIANVKIDDDVIPKKVPKTPKPKPSPAAEIKDETYVINKDLYLLDVKNQSKYGKQFKKPKNFIYNEKFTDNMKIKCGRCKAEMTFRHYKMYHQSSHYYLCWIDGEPEINMKDDSEMIRILQAAITPDALKKKAIRLTCEKCGDVRKSVVGYVSHVRFCQKEDKDNLFETCTLCGRTLRPSSVRFHYIKFHGHKFKSHDESLIFSQNNTENAEDFDDSDDGRDASLVKRYRMGFTKTYLQKTDIVGDEQFWKALKTSYDLYMCMGLSCRHMTVSKDDLKTHILHCNARFCEFSCSSCPYKTKYENEIIYHSKKNCQETSDGDPNKDDVKEDAVERRVSTRKKKRKLMYDDFNELNETSDDDKSKLDQDFETDAESDDEEYDSDSDSRKSRSKKRKSDRPISNISDKFGLRNAFQQYCMGRSDPLRWTVDLRLKLFSSTPLHVHMKVNTKEWEIVPSSQIEKYIPAHQKSMKVCFDNTPYSQFKLFQSDVIKGVPVCFAGGPVWSMAWAPLPAQVTEQYLAVSTLQHVNHIVEIGSSISFPSLIQFWKYSSIDNISNDIQKPTLAWSIAHNFGAIWSMEWCPSGGFNNLSTTCRLGILAAATSSGYVIIYNVPKLDISGEIDVEPKDVLANPKPDMILKIRAENVQCTRLVWDQISPHNTLIGGFSDGSVAFWNINTASVLLKKGNVIYPYRTFEAHNAPITALDLHWLNNSRFLLTGAWDRVTRYWDLNDLSGPMYEFERATPVMNAIWMQHWIVTANVHDFGALVGETGAFLTHPRDSVEKRKTLLNVRDAFWSVSYSLWNDMVAVSSNGGYVSAYAAKHLSLLTYKNSEFEKIVTSTELVDLNEDEKQSIDAEELISKLPQGNNLFDSTETVQNSAVKFIDRAKMRPTNETISFDLEKCSLTSVNKVCWNQNYNSFNWVAVGYECGFVRVIRVERFDKQYLTKFYKTNENTATLM